MTEIIFPLSSTPGSGRQESGGRLINAYTEKLGDNARAKTVRRRCPGLTDIASNESYAHVRGFHYSNNVLYIAYDDWLYKLTRAGSVYTLASVGELFGTGLVTFAENNAEPPAIVAITSEGAFNIFSDAAPTSFAGVVASPNSVSSLGGYLIFTNRFGEIFATGLNTVTIASDSFTTAQAKSDSLLRGIAFRGEFFACGQTSIEVYSNEGTQPFPLRYKTAIPRGLKGQWAIGGYQDGWSNELCWVGDDNVAYQLDGYKPVPISTPDQERDFADTTTEDDIEAYVYMHSGNAVLSISSPSWTWEFNLKTRLWHERKSYLGSRWRVSQTIKAFDQWLAGDRTTGKIFAISEDEYEESGDPLIFTVESAPSSAFPGRVSVPRMDFDMEVGVGLVSGEDTEIEPVVGISWSDDGGATFCSPVERSLGRIMNVNTTINVNRTGMAGSKGRIVRIEVSDPVRVGLYGGTMVLEGRTV